MTTAPDLDTTRQELLASISFPSTLNDQWPPELKLLEPGFVQHLLKDYGFTSDGRGDGLLPESLTLGENGREAILQSDIAMLRQLRSTGEDLEYASPFQTVEAIYPIRIKEHIVGHLWTGKVFKGPLSDSNLENLARALGLPPDELTAHRDGLSTQNDRQLAATFETARNTRDVLEQSIRQHLQIKQYTSQLLESERTHSLGSLSSGIAHHFNNLLSVILGYSSLVLNKEELNDDSSKALRQISDAAQQGRRLTEEILAFTGSDVEEPEICALHDTMSSVLSLLQSQAASSIRIESRFNADNDAVLAYPSEIRQIVFNLISSAMDGMPSGGNLTITTSNTTLDCSVSSPDCIRIEVLDSGAMGNNVPEEEMAFYDQNNLPLVDDDQLNQKRSSLYGMVGRMRGNVTVSSNTENHTRVEVLLPLAAELGAEEETKARKRLAPSNIWVVDDD
ncbi:MAG: histidine kinase dimerization/phospho-acceptor domain-containing protein, partial [Verrucomicrobiota bacterium]